MRYRELAGIDGATKGRHDQTAFLKRPGTLEARAAGVFDFFEHVFRDPRTRASGGAALPVGPGVYLDQNAAAATTIPVTDCRSTDTGGVLFYRVTVGAGETLTASATAAYDFFNLGLRLLDACGASECLASSIGGVDRALSYTNTTDAPRELVLAVGARSPAGAGPFDLAIGLHRAPGYAITTTAAACDDLSGAASLGVSTYGAASAPQPLPFAFELFGEPQGWLAAASHGHAMLYPTLPRDLPVYSRSTNRALPADIEPARMLAVLWDELAPRPGADVRVATFGSAPSRHVTVEWRDWSFAPAGDGRLRFQLKLYEGTQRIEYHYCELTPGTDAERASGGSATIGLEDASQSIAVQHAFDLPGSVDASTALVFTPTSR